jgi:hypothetical protein
MLMSATKFILTFLVTTDNIIFLNVCVYNKNRRCLRIIVMKYEPVHAFKGARTPRFRLIQNLRYGRSTWRWAPNSW